jgi:hypothetical protein
MTTVMMMIAASVIPIRPTAEPGTTATRLDRPRIDALDHLSGEFAQGADRRHPERKRADDPLHDPHPAVIPLGHPPLSHPYIAAGSRHCRHQVQLADEQPVNTRRPARGHFGCPVTKFAAAASGRARIAT